MMLLASAAAFGAAGGLLASALSPATVFAQTELRIQRNAIIRIRPAPIAVLRAEPPIKWKEKGSPDCIRLGNMAGAIVSGATSIDLIIRGGARYRVKLEKSCQAVDFYSGFYVKPTPDGNICKDRDMIHSRTGGACAIDRFRNLVPAR